MNNDNYKTGIGEYNDWEQFLGFKKWLNAKYARLGFAIDNEKEIKIKDFRIFIFYFLDGGSRIDTIAFVCVEKDFMGKKLYFNVFECKFECINKVLDEFDYKKKKLIFRSEFDKKEIMSMVLSNDVFKH